MRKQIRMLQGRRPSLATLFIRFEGSVSQQAIFLLLSAVKNFMEGVISQCDSFKFVSLRYGNDRKRYEVEAKTGVEFFGPHL